MMKNVTQTTGGDLDIVTLGQRVRHLRRARGMTLAQLAAAAGSASSALSMIENGRREPRLSLLQAIAGALEFPVEDLLRPEPPSRRASLEIALERAQRESSYASLGLPALRPSPRIPTDVLEHVVAMHDELRRRDARFAATPEAARQANVDLRRHMRSVDNYFPEIEHAAGQALKAVGYAGGALPQRLISDLAAHFGFSLHNVTDLPQSTRSVTDLEHRRIYLPQQPAGHDPRYVVLQTVGHFALGHTDPTDFADFLRQRVEANYFAAATLVPEDAASRFLTEAKRDRAIDMEDIRDVFAVSHETAAHRFTNLATHHLGLPVHFSRTDSSGTIYKAYENDGLDVPHRRDRRDRGPGRLPGVLLAPGLHRAGALRHLRAVHRHARAARSSAPRTCSPVRPASSPSPSAYRSSTRSGSATPTPTAVAARPARR